MWGYIYIYIYVYFFFPYFIICMLIGFVGIIRKLEDGCLGEYGYGIIVFQGRKVLNFK